MDVAIIRIDDTETFKKQLYEHRSNGAVGVHDHDRNMIMVNGASGVCMMRDGSCQVQIDDGEGPLTFGKSGTDTASVEIIQAY